LQESKLIQQLKLGDGKAFRKLVEMHKDRVYNTCLGFLHHPEDAEDTAQEVFMQVYESIGSFEQESALSTWIYRIAVNKSLELLRKRNRKKRRGFFMALLNSDQPDEAEDRTFFLQPGIAMEKKEEAKILMEAIDSLPDRQRIAFTLHKIENLSYKEIAEIMEISLAAVESLIHRALKNLRKSLYVYYSEKE